MSNDAQRMVEVFLLLNNGLFAPFQIIGIPFISLGRLTNIPFFSGSRNAL